jgi:hypothetical protein
VTLRTEAGTDLVFPPANPATEPCDHCTLDERVPWTEVSVDLQALRGQRVVVRATPSRFNECAPDLYEELALDDFRIE